MWSNVENNLIDKCVLTIEKDLPTTVIEFEDSQHCYFAGTREVEAALKAQDVFESGEKAYNRASVLCNLNALVKKWIRKVSIARGIPEDEAEHVGGRIFTFGSYKLDVHCKGADIDALCVAPRHVYRSDYFTSFVKLLKAEDNIVELRTIEEAYVPVIKMKISDIEIDLLFARLMLEKIPENLDLNDNELLVGLDPKCVRSLNGCRTTDEIMRLVPNIENFRLTLRAIRLWAKRNGIYSNILGYLGGVSWTILVAKTCRMYPTADAATLIKKFFVLFSQWKWPAPVHLKPLEDVKLGFPVWDRTVNILDKEHLMPIITPSYPEQNSTFNVSISTRTVIIAAFERGLSTLKNIATREASWDTFFEPAVFFGKYRHYLALFAKSLKPQHHLEWCGFIEAKIRHLIRTLEQTQHVTLAHVNPKVYTPKELNANGKCSMWFIGLTFKKGEALNLDLTDIIEIFIETTKRQAESIKLLKEGMNLEAKYVRNKELKNYISPTLVKKDKKTCKNLITKPLVDTCCMTQSKA